jgi:hypothetical protein
MKLWWCVECQANVELGKHGRCGTCGSEAVDLLPEDCELSHSGSAVAVVSDSALACS